MKKIAAILGALLVVLTVLTFVACENGVQKISGDVGLNVPKAPAVSEVFLRTGTGKDAYIVNWYAVAEDLEYVVYVQQEGKKSYVLEGIQGQNQYRINNDGWGLLYDPNPDRDNWTVVFGTKGIYRHLDGDILSTDPDKAEAALAHIEDEILPGLEGNGLELGKFASVAGKYRFGVRSYYPASAGTIAASDIKWTNYVTIGALAMTVTNYQFNPTTKVITWDSTGTDGFHVHASVGDTNYQYLGYQTAKNFDLTSYIASCASGDEIAFRVEPVNNSSGNDITLMGSGGEVKGEAIFADPITVE